MFRAAYGLGIFFFLYIRMVRCVTVQQNPTLILANKNKMAEIKCSHYDRLMLTMLWYQQKDTATALIVSSYAVFSDGVLITQWPEYISSLPGSSAEMHCYQNDTNYDYKYWYRQIKGEGPVLIGSYIISTSSKEKDFENGFEVSADFSDCVLITQWPKYISSLPGSSVEMHCYQNDTDYDYKFWYRQMKGDLVLVGSYIVNSPSNEKGFETGFTVSGKIRCVTVQQDPTPIFANKKEMAEIKCSHDDSSMPNMQWYQQKDTAMTLIMFSYGATTDFSDGVLITQWPKYISSYAGSSAEIHCYQNDTDYNYKYWYRQIKGEGLVLIGSYNFNSASEEKGFEKGFKMSESLEGITITQNDQLSISVNTGSVAYFGNGTKLTVLDTKITITPPKVNILKPSEKETRCRKDKVTLVCVASDFYPDHVNITWKFQGKDIEEGVATDPYATKNETSNMYTMTSRLKVSRKDWGKEANKFVCSVKFYNATDVHVEINATVSGIAGGGYEPEKPKGLKLLGFGYILFLSKSLLYALIVAGVVCKLKFSAEKKQLPED
ncbi:T-cell receptor type 1 [Labeo rohita]|nr:T-cell receptor type 1 [Labeo rohita]